MARNKLSAHDLMRKVDELIALCKRLRDENEKLRADNALMRAQIHGMHLNQRSAYRNINNLAAKARDLEEKI